MTYHYLVVPFGEVASHRKEFITIDDTAEYKRCRVQLHAQGIVERDRVPGVMIRTKEQQLCRASELLVAEIDAKVGGFGIVPPELEGAIVSSHYFLFASDATRIHPEFLGYFVKTPAFRDQVNARGSTNYAAIRPHHVLEYQIPLPPLEEQQRIVAKIKRLAAKIDEARVMHDRSTITVGVFDAASTAAVAHSVPAAHWRPLGEIVEVSGGGTPSKGNPAFWGGDVPWISPKDMKHRRVCNATDYITRTAVDNSSARLHAPGCVLIVVRGMILAHTVPIGVLDVPATINQDLKALRPDPGIDPDYLCSILWALNGEMLALIDRSTHDTRKFDTSKLLDFRVPAPPPAEQRRMVTCLDRLQAKVDHLKALQAQTRAELDALLPSILDRAFKGEL